MRSKIKDTTSRAENKINGFIFYPEAPCIFKLQSRLKVVQEERNAKSQRVNVEKMLVFSLLNEAEIQQS